MRTPRSYRTLHTYLLVMVVIAAGIFLQSPAEASGKPAGGSDDEVPIYSSYPVIYWNEDTEGGEVTTHGGASGIACAPTRNDGRFLARNM